MSQIITFYSYKGGVGRSMALANVATLLSKWGKRVLMIDWDLEAPGLENFFKEYLTEIDWGQQKGILDWLYAKQNKEDLHWQDLVIPFKTQISTTNLHLLISGKSNGNYADMLRDFSVPAFYDEHNGGRIIEQLRDELKAQYDYILIDSRTGVTDFGGICTIQMPDIVVMLFSPTEQGLAGTKMIAERMLKSHQQVPFDRYRLLVFPVPSRFDATPEFKESQKWFGKIATELHFLYDDVLPANANLFEFLQVIKIPYKPYFSFGEKLPVIEEGTVDPAGLGYAYENLAMLVGRGLDSMEGFLEKREEYLEEVSGQISENTKPEPPPANDSGSVLIYISYVHNDKYFKDKLVEKIRNNPLSIPVRISEFGQLKIGASKTIGTVDKLKSSDIVFIIVSSSYEDTYFPTEAERAGFYGNDPYSIPVFMEYNVIEKTKIRTVVPIFLTPPDINTPHFITDRVGIPADESKTISDPDDIMDEITTLLNEVYQDKKTRFFAESVI